jgi:glycosyltransferase involved in cell wall biosynthesis
MQYKFSIIISVYNLEKYISKAIDSVLSQNFNNYEIIIINDGSTDNTWSILEQYAISHDNINIVNNEKNIGLGASRNVGLSICKGQYILFLDGDDYLYDNSTLERINSVVSISNPDIAFFGMQYIGRF